MIDQDVNPSKEINRIEEIRKIDHKINPIEITLRLDIDTILDQEIKVVLFLTDNE